MERSSITRDFPVAKAAYSLLKDVSSSFCFPGWNKGRITCQKSQLKRIFVSPKSSDDSDIESIISLSNTPFPLSGTRASSAREVKQQKNSDNDVSFRTNTELMATGV